MIYNKSKKKSKSNKDNKAKKKEKKTKLCDYIIQQVKYFVKQYLLGQPVL